MILEGTPVAHKAQQGSRDGGHSVSELGATAEGREGAEERVPSMISTPVRYDVAPRQQNLPAPHKTDCAEYAPYILYIVPLSDFPRRAASMSIEY